MSFTVSDLEEHLTGMAHSTTLNKVKNKYRVYERAAMTMIGKVDPEFTKREVEITNALHSGIYDYSCPSDIKGDKVIDIRPQLNRNIDDKLRQRYAREFDLEKAENTFHIWTADGEKVLKLSKSISPSPVVIHEFDSLTANGTLSEGGDVETLAIDTLRHISGGGSLRFNFNGSGTDGYIENSDLNSVDLEDYDERGDLFLRVYMPDEDRITQIALRWGNDSSNYWTQTATTPHDQDEFKKGWNIVRFGWDGATETGTVDPSAIDYIRITFTYDGTVDTDFRVDKLSCSLGEIWEVVYYSKYLFQSSGGTWKEEVSDETDIINLDTDGFQIYLLECLKALAQQKQGEDMISDYNYAENELSVLYPKYRVNHPSEAGKKQDIGYRMGLLKRGIGRKG